VATQPSTIPTTIPVTSPPITYPPVAATGSYGTAPPSTVAYRPPLASAPHSTSNLVEDRAPTSSRRGANYTPWVVIAATAAVVGLGVGLKRHAKGRQ
jgi:hypothetical protein